MLPIEELLPHPAGATVRTDQNPARNRHSAQWEDITSVQDSHLAEMEEWQLACRLADSKRLCKSDRLPKFLLYICEQTLMGNAQSITEQRIGTHIFNRPTDYNPGEDNIVRSYARMLRKRLDEYFDAEGRHEPLRITIPRGGYVPIFIANADKFPADHNAIQPATSENVTSDAGPTNSTRRISLPLDVSRKDSASTRRSFWIVALICMLVGSGVGVFAGWFAHSRDDGGAQELAHPVWAELFQKNRGTLIVPADSGLGILQNLTGKLIPLEDYANGSYFSGETSLPGITAANLADLRGQRYTSVVDLEITANLMRLSELSDGHADIRYARSITAEDLKSSNAILLGSSHTNPWVSLFEDRMNFRLQYSPTVDASLILNERPKENEQKLYLNGTGSMANPTYGVIGYLPNLDGSGHVLIIQGLNMAATEAAADVLFHSPDIRGILHEARLPNGALRSFELLIQTHTIGATDHGAQIIAKRFYN